MKIAVLVCRILLGLMFAFFGLNNILHFLPMKEAPGDAGLYSGLLATHGVMTFVGVLMVIAGLLLLVGRFVPIALVILGPILVNILMFHLLFAHGAGMLPGLVATALELVLIAAYRNSFIPLFAPNPLIVRP